MEDSRMVHAGTADMIGSRILRIRGQRVILDADLAELYGVTTSNLDKAVKRNLRRFPDAFMFRMIVEESERGIFHIGISQPIGRGGSRHLYCVFTEHRVAMLSSVLRSEKAIQVNMKSPPEPPQGRIGFHRP